ncbi:conserved Plasmodium protein, unknown function [Plasmodium ovale]|uniref:Zinc finger protein n=2 Tax=Plasmodium ovale TaxID=36330 RepID=A0A1A8W6H7_PLAOA|nr:hypothetical protein, conserved [Plasmodium ovale curtisi]SBS97695.1 hypothetical protein, conserved [Plasmodium ovale curtisi]SCP06270.1 conserved Plasmodium protein, unknown function [Plasmodium ovale]
MIDTFIYWNFKGSKGGANILRISLPCSYNTIKKKIIEATNLNLQNNLDILLYHNNRVLSEYESIQTEMLIEIQRSHIDVVNESLQNSNKNYLEKNKSIIEKKTSLTNVKSNENYNNNINRSVGDRSNVYDPSKVPKISRTQYYPYGNNKPWNVYNRNSLARNNDGSGIGSCSGNGNGREEDVDHCEDDEDMKIQEAMERNNLYHPDYNRARMNYYKRDKNSTNFFQNKLKKISTPVISKKNFNTYNNAASRADSFASSAAAMRQRNMNDWQNRHLRVPNTAQKDTHNSYGAHNGHAGNGGASVDDVSSKYVPPDYICHMCGKKGHSIKNCTMSNFNNNKKIKVPTGIPTNFLTKIKAEDIYKYDQIYILKDGSYGIMKDVEDVSGSAYLYRSVDDKINIYMGVNGSGNNNNGGRGSSSSSGSGSGSGNRNRNNNEGGGKNESSKISSIYKCLLCKKLYTSPITLHCCGETYCKSCLYKFNKKRKNDYLSYYSSGGQKGQVMKCPNCSKLIHSDELIINTNIKNVIDTIIKNQKISDINELPGGNNTQQNGTLSTINREKTKGSSQENGGNNIHVSSSTGVPTSYSNHYSESYTTGEMAKHIGELTKNGKMDNKQEYKNGISSNSFSGTHNNKLKEENASGNSSSSILNENDGDLQDSNFNPLANFPINLHELKKQHDFAAAYIAQYRLRRKEKKKRKRNVDLNMLLMSKRVC